MGDLFGILLHKKTSSYLKTSNAVLLVGYAAVDGIPLCFLGPCHQMIVCVNWNGHLWNYVVISFLLIYSTLLFPIKSPSSSVISVHLYLLVLGNTPYQFFCYSQQSIPYVTLFLAISCSYRTKSLLTFYLYPIVMLFIVLLNVTFLVLCNLF